MDVIITNGTQQALDLVVRVLLAPGDRVAVEDPSYRPPRLLFASHGLRVRGVPVDDEGLVVDAIPRDVRLVYVTPSHQYPLGMTMSLPRRVALLAWAERHNAAIVEDDYDSEFRYGGRPIEPLQTLDRDGRVIYVGSFSKTMLPTLRMGFAVVPPPIRHAMRAARYVSDWHGPIPTQRALTRFIDEGFLANHVRKMRAIYAARHQQITETLAHDFGDTLALIPSAAGLHVSAVATSHSAADFEAIADEAPSAGLGVQLLSFFPSDRAPMAGLALGYGGIDVAEIEEGLGRLHALVRSLSAR